MTEDGPSSEGTTPKGDESEIELGIGERPARTPFYQAFHTARYERQELIAAIERHSKTRLVCFVCGNRTHIDRDDTLGFADLLHRLPHGESLDLLLHTGGGDIDVAEKLVSMIRNTVADGRFRVIIPDFAKSAGTLIALAADTILMSDTSELGPIDPQVLLDDGQGGRRWISVLSYLEAYREHSLALKKDPNDVVAQIMLGKFQPAMVKQLEAVKKRAKQVAENHLKQWMFRTKVGNFTLIPAELMNLERFPSHGQMIGHDDAVGIGLSVTKMPPNDPAWLEYWRLYCLQRLAVKDHEKLFESQLVSLPVESS